uniref:Uncharacterized protein n=1 Tax=Timema poppense TaxID=170557 RepID=A0A7R9D3C9_TIMPO|nr:unnamed protein product [Timema poppensis]
MSLGAVRMQSIHELAAPQGCLKDSQETAERTELYYRNWTEAKLNNSLSSVRVSAEAPVDLHPAGPGFEPRTPRYWQTRLNDPDTYIRCSSTWMDINVCPQESFVGLYSVKKTTGEHIASVLCDVMIRLQLPVINLRGQTYDGVGNMSGSEKEYDILEHRDCSSYFQVLHANLRYDLVL